MERRLGSARAVKTRSAIASMSGGIELDDPLYAVGKTHDSLRRWQPISCDSIATNRLRQLA
jgi:hypothetical protein